MGVGVCEQGGAEPRWGEETTDESDGEVAHYNGRRKEILDSAATVFADASEEFASLPALKARLEAWKAGHGSELPVFLPRLSIVINVGWQQRTLLRAATIVAEGANGSSVYFIVLGMAFLSASHPCV